MQKDTPALKLHEAFGRSCNSLVKKHEHKILFDKAAAEEHQRFLNGQKKFTENHLEKNGAKLISSLAEAFPAKKPIFIDGGILDKNGAYVQSTEALVKSLLDCFDPNKAYFVTTGNDYGVQKIVQQEVARYNKKNPEHPFALVGAVAERSKVRNISKELTHAFVPFHAWFALHAFVAESVEKNNMFVCVIGGGMQSRDIIQDTYNALAYSNRTTPNQNLLLVRGPAGAAEDKAPFMKPQFSCNFADVCEYVYAKNAEQFKDSTSLVPFQCRFDKHLEAIKRHDKADAANALNRQGRVDGLSNNDRATYLSKMMQKVSTRVTKNIALDYVIKGCPSDHLVAEIMRKHADHFLNSEFEPFNVYFHRPNDPSYESRLTSVLIDETPQLKQMRMHPTESVRNETSATSKRSENDDENDGPRMRI